MDERERIAAEERRRKAEEQKRSDEAAAAAMAIVLQANLKDLGYDVKVSASDLPGEVVITSEEFADTDHRVRFLAMMRGRKAPLGTCGFTRVRLRSSGLPRVGFNESYSLDCSS